MGKIAFIGAGNMAAAFIGGLLEKRAFPPDHLACLSGTGRTAQALATRTGISWTSELPLLLRDADAVVVAFKPQHLAQADQRLAELTSGKLILSVLAGKRLSSLGRVFPHARNIVRSMPNTPGQIGAGITAWAAQNTLTATDLTLIQTLLGALGQVIEVKEDDLDAVTGVSGSGPAYVFEFAGALRDAGVAAGLSPAAAQQLSVETLLGAARLLARQGESPEALRDKVTSPNGTTFAGLQQLKAGDFRGLIRATVLAAAARSRELSRDT